MLFDENGKPVFNRPYARVEVPEKVYSQEDNVDRSSYVSLESQVSAMILAGQSLMDSRRFAYDFPDGKVPPGAMPDITRYYDFDAAVARAHLMEKAKEIKEAQLEAKRAAEQSIKESGREVRNSDVRGDGVGGKAQKGASQPSEGGDSDS